MSGVLFAAYAIQGHYRIVLGTEHELVKMGHRVGFVSERQLPKLEALGIEVLPMEDVLPPPPTGEEKNKLLADPDAMLAWQRWTRLEMPRLFVEPFRRAIREFRPDVMAIDSVMYGAIFAAALERVPVVSVWCTLAPFLPDFSSEAMDRAALWSKEREALFASYGIEGAQFRAFDYVSPLHNLSFAHEALVGRVAPSTSAPLCLAGPSIAPQLAGDAVDFPWEKLRDDAPLLYTSFGSMNYWQPAIIRVLAEAAAALGLQHVIVAGDRAGDPALRDLPGSPIVVSFAPQTELLKRVAVFVTHAGHGSVLEASERGVPMLAIPITSDQPANAHIVSAVARTGLTLQLAEVTPERCRAAISTLLTSPEIRARVEEVRRACTGRDGSRVAAELLLKIGEQARAG